MNIIPSQQRINHLIHTFSDGGFEAAQITNKSCQFYYLTELQDIGPLYIMDDFGNAIQVGMNMLVQKMYIHPPLTALT